MPDIVVTDVIASCIVKAIEGSLDDCSDVIIGIGDTRPLAVVLTDSKTQRILGGAIGLSSVGLLFLDSFFLPKEFRGRGLGTEILKQFEREGRRRGCQSAFLYTVNLSDFYAQNGWKTNGRMPCDPAGTFRFFMTKNLEAFS
ncbi:GNAT family N-acetyltransferase [Bradyrhizobium sp. 24]|uniref:GNAT family N-acetyltransferase n=1 Tax=unclassified Bradyrhizobium TaxID=2631580 RepID=UPI001FFA8D0C|nr:MULTISPECIES: GNAT family N-acetyltransferase [unclassified Bradyrhizobium]MCK1296629.1 GNAT family N-acetyltransferase [Bradyrhizobium sp. 37]MCK1379558.1 GNAT family N-acetyltransferase [Bradyrhizobium sp. 24]MCK1768563.1 GNAT family N-acetyltransferase [Bradyrhizobium sp. 134]